MATISSFKTRVALLTVGALLSFQSAAGCRSGGSGKLTSGTELVFQVQVQDAFAAAADSTIERLRTDLRADKIQVADDAITRTEPETVEDAGKLAILIKGLPETQASNFRNIVDRPAYSQWTLSPVSAPSDYKMTLTPAAAAKVRTETVHGVMSVIERRMNALGFQTNGLAKKMWIGLTAHPDAPEFVVQYSPVDDPSHVVEVLKTGGVMEWDEVNDGPFVSHEEALAKHAGALPPNTKIVPEVPKGGGRRFWIVSMPPIIRGSDLIGATAAQGEMRGWETDFTLSPEAAKRFEAYTSASIGKQAALIVDGQALTVPTIQSTISDRGRISGARTQQEAADLAIVLRASLPARLIALEQRRIGSNPDTRTPNPERTQ